MAVVSPLPIGRTHRQRISQGQLLRCLQLQEEARIASEKYRQAIHEVIDDLNAGRDIEHGRLSVVCEESDYPGSLVFRVEVRK